jgi:DNA-binding beta-propeller fold protein YncE
MSSGSFWKSTSSSGKTLYVFISSVRKVQVVDTKKREVVATWPTSSQRNGDGAFDEKNHRLFIGTRTPPKMIVMDSNTGKEVAALPTVEGMDGVYFNAAQKRIYVSGGRDNGVGYIFVISRKMRTITKPSAKYPRSRGPAPSFGRRNAIASISGRHPAARKKRRFLYLSRNLRISFFTYELVGPRKGEKV